MVVFFIGMTYAQNANDAIRLAAPGYSTNARAMGMGNSFLSLSDDASAMYFNPAGLGLINRMEFATGFDYLSLNNKTAFFGTEKEYATSATSLNQAALVFPFPTVRGSLVFGVAYNQSKQLEGALKFDGFNAGTNSMIQELSGKGSIPYWLYLTDSLGNTAINGNLNQSGSTLESGALREWVFSGAIEAEKNFFVGVNVSILSGKYTNDREYFEDDTKGIYYNVALDPVDPLTKKFQSFELKNSLNWEITGWDVKFGLLYQLQKIARFGITVQLPKTYTIKEEFITEGASSFGTGKYYSLDPNDYTDKVEYDVVTPFTFAGGASVNIEGLIVSADATLIDYTQTKFDNASGISGTAVSAMNKDIKDNLRAVVNYNAGLEYFIPRTGLRLRAGYFIQRSPYLDDPSQYDRQYYSFGAGAMISDNAMVDLAYMHGWWDDIGDNYGFKLSRTAQKLTSENISLSLHYRF
jgi:hypothetical protein